MTRREKTVAFKRMMHELKFLILTNFRLIAGGGLILYLRSKKEPINSKGTRLWINNAWRLQSAQNIIVGSEDAPGFILKQLNKIISEKILSIKINRVGDICVLFRSDRLQTFSMQQRDELWEIRRPDGYRIIMRDGGRYLIKHEPDAENIKIPENWREKFKKIKGKLTIKQFTSLMQK